MTPFCGEFFCLWWRFYEASLTRRERRDNHVLRAKYLLHHWLHVLGGTELSSTQRCIMGISLFATLINVPFEMSRIFLETLIALVLVIPGFEGLSIARLLAVLA